VQALTAAGCSRQSEEIILDSKSASPFYSKKNLQPETAPPTPDNNLSMLSFPLQVIIGNQKSSLITTPTTTIPAVPILALVASKILQIHNLQTSMKNITSLLGLHPIQTKRAIILSAENGVR
jgi:hypothetical protein